MRWSRFKRTRDDALPDSWIFKHRVLYPGDSIYISFSDPNSDDEIEVGRVKVLTSKEPPYEISVMIERRLRKADR